MATVRKWWCQAQVDAGDRPEMTSEESAELKRLNRENAELKRANAILKSASAFLRARARPVAAFIVTYINGHVGGREGEDRLQSGVESICTQLTELGATIAPATYYEHRSRTPTSPEVREAELKPKFAAVHPLNYGVSGARKVRLTLNRECPQEEPPIAHCIVERLMRELGLEGAL